MSEPSVRLHYFLIMSNLIGALFNFARTTLDAENFDGEDLARDLQNWMANLPESLKVTPLIHLAIPGTHNSGTYAIDFKSKLAIDKSFVKIILLPSSFVISKWAKTQNFNTTQQLEHGVRFFDLRVEMEKTRFNIVHGLISIPVSVFLHDIERFLTKHPREVVIILIQHLYAFDSDDDHLRFIKMIINVLGNKLMTDFESRWIGELTIEYLLDNGVQVLVIYNERDVEELIVPFISSRFFWYPWPNATTGHGLTQFLDKALRYRFPSLGFVAQFLLTPTCSVIQQYLFGSLRSYTLDEIYKSDTFNWLSKQAPGPFGVNIIMADFVDSCNCKFTKTVINLNKKLIK